MASRFIGKGVGSPFNLISSDKDAYNQFETTYNTSYKQFAAAKSVNRLSGQKLSPATEPQSASLLPVTNASNHNGGQQYLTSNTSNNTNNNIINSNLANNPNSLTTMSLNDRIINKPGDLKKPYSTVTPFSNLNNSSSSSSSSSLSNSSLPSIGQNSGIMSSNVGQNHNTTPHNSNSQSFPSSTIIQQSTSGSGGGSSGGGVPNSFVNQIKPNYEHMVTQIAPILNDNNLFLSSYHALNANRLRQLGVTLVISAMMDPPNIPGLNSYTANNANNIASGGASSTQPRIVHIAVEDSIPANIEQHFDRVADLIHHELSSSTSNTSGSATATSPTRKVLVHCMAGISRSSTLILAYLIKHRRMSLRDAYNHVRQRRPYVFPNLGFWRKLIAFEQRHLPAGAKASVRMVQLRPPAGGGGGGGLRNGSLFGGGAPIYAPDVDPPINPGTMPFSLGPMSGSMNIGGATTSPLVISGNSHHAGGGAAVGNSSFFSPVNSNRPRPALTRF